MSSSNSGLFTPAIKLLQRMAIPRKFGIILLLFLIPLAYLSYKAIVEKGRDIHFFQVQQQGLMALQPATESLHRLTTIRDLSYAGALGYGIDHAALNGAIKEMEDYLLRLRPLADGMAQEQLERIARQWQSFENAQMSPLEMNVALSRLALSLRELHLRMAEQYGLTLGRDGKRYQLSRIVTNNLLATIDLVSALRGLGTGIISRGQFTPDSYIRLASLADELDGELNALHHAYKAALADHPGERPLLKRARTTIDRGRDYLAATRGRVLEPDSFLIDAAPFFEQGTQLLGEMEQLYQLSNQALYQLQGERIGASRWDMYEVIALSVFITLLVSYLFGGFYFSMKQGIAAINHTLERIAEGDLGQRARLDSRDEVNAIANKVNYMAEHIASLVSNMAGASKEVVSSAEQMAAITEQTLSGIRQQNSEIDMVSTAVNELSATVAEVARNAAQASDAAQTADDEAGSGQRVVNHAIGAIRSLAGEVQSAAEVIQRLERESDNIGTVVNVIREIAEQTNLLALNAAIEAARAGDQGRGFAVVADEVRTLAVRTQESTEEIRSLIEGLQASARDAAGVMISGREQAEQSVAEAAEAGGALEVITDAVSHIRDLNAQIATAAEEQSQVTEEVNRNIVSIRNISAQTAEGADQTASAGVRLKQLSSEMETLVARFKLGSV